jgi:hypothetical protein
MPSLAKNAISKTFKFNLAVWYFFGKGDYVAYHLDDCCLVSGSSKYPTFTSCNNLALEAVILHWLFKQSTCNCSNIPFDCQHATAEQTLHRPISSIAAHVDPYKIPTSHPTLPMAIHWLAHTNCFIFKIVSALREDGLPLQTCLPANLTHFWCSQTQLIFKSIIPH